MELDREHYFQVEIAPTDTEDWVLESSRTFDLVENARKRLRTCKREMEEWRFRIVRKTIITELWSERHVKPSCGQCPECGHYGKDCTGAGE